MQLAALNMEHVTVTAPSAHCLPAAVKGVSISVQSNKTYEQTFDLEMKKALEGKTKNTPWGSTFRAPPEVLHGELG